jgi:hypothetical protein
MATLDTINTAIANAKQTPSGKVEWIDTSLKGIIQDVVSLFVTNGIQLTANVVSLQTLAGANGQTAIVTSNTDPTKNGIYYFGNTGTGVYYPATDGYWILSAAFVVGNTSTQKYLSVDEANSQLELGQYVTTTGSHTVIDKWIKVNVPGVGIRYLPLYQ